VNGEVYCREIQPSDNQFKVLSKIQFHLYSSNYRGLERELANENPNKSVSYYVDIISNDLHDFSEKIKNTKFKKEFLLKWGAENSQTTLRRTKLRSIQVQPLSLSLFDKMDIISKEILKVIDNALLLKSNHVDLSESDKGFLLITQFITDLLGASSPEGRLFTSIYNEKIKIENTPELIKKFLILGIIILINVSFILVVISVTIYDDEVWFYSFFPATFAITLVLDMIVHFLSVLIHNFLIPNIIHDTVMFAKQICMDHFENFISSNFPFSNYETFSASRYLHASHLYAQSLEQSIEKVFVSSYISTFPGRAGWMWNNDKSLVSNFGLLIIKLSCLFPRKFNLVVIKSLFLLSFTIIFLEVNSLLSELIVYILLSVLMLSIISFTTYGLFNPHRINKVYPEELFSDTIGVESKSNLKERNRSESLTI